jgi:hypothetical protein
LSAFCSAAQRIFFLICFPRSEKFEKLPTKVTQIDCILFSCKEKFWSLSTKAIQIDCILFSTKRKIWEFDNKNNSNHCILFCQRTCSEDFWDLSTTRNSNWLQLVLPCSEKFGNLPTKSTQVTAFCSVVQPKIWK